MEPLGYHAVFAAGQKGLHLGGFLVQLLGEIVEPVRGDDQRFGGLEGIQNKALVIHAAAAKTLHIHAQNRLVFPGTHRLHEPEHLRPGEQAFAGDNFLIDVFGLHLIAVPLRVGHQGGLVAAEGILQAHMLFGPGFAQVHGAAHPPALAGVFFKLFPAHGAHLLNRHYRANGKHGGNRWLRLLIRIQRKIHHHRRF